MSADPMTKKAAPLCRHVNRRGARCPTRATKAENNGMCSLHRWHQPHVLCAHPTCDRWKHANALTPYCARHAQLSGVYTRASKATRAELDRARAELGAQSLRVAEMEAEARARRLDDELGAILAEPERVAEPAPLSEAEFGALLDKLAEPEPERVAEPATCGLMTMDAVNRLIAQLQAMDVAEAS